MWVVCCEAKNVENYFSLSVMENDLLSEPQWIGLLAKNGLVQRIQEAMSEQYQEDACSSVQQCHFVEGYMDRISEI